MKTKWYDEIDFYKLTGITLLWISSWIFMLPVKTNINTPLFDNIFGEFLAVFGAVTPSTTEAQQTPDLASGIIALITVTILHLRGILSITTPAKEKITEKSNGAIITILSILSLIVHTLFFTMLAKIFLFPTDGSSSVIQSLRENIYITIFAAFCIGGMIMGMQSLAKILIILFSMAALLKNVTFVSRYMGVHGFIAIILAATGFYLELIKDGFSRRTLLLEANILLGNYNKLNFSAQEKTDE